jgi:hypothetical protein
LGEGRSDARVADEVVVLAITLLVLRLGALFIAESSSEVGEEKQFVVCDFGEFLGELYEVGVFQVQASAVAYHDEGGVKLPDLVEQKVL